MALILAAWLLTQPINVADVLGFAVQSVEPVEVDGNPATLEWLVIDGFGLYHVVTEAPFCIGEAFHPDGTEPSLLPKAVYPAVRVGERHRLVAFNVATQTLINERIPMPTICLKF